MVLDALIVVDFYFVFVDAVDGLGGEEGLLLSALNRYLRVLLWQLNGLALLSV